MDHISGAHWHASIHGVPTGDHGSRGWLKRVCNRLARRIAKAVIAEQVIGG